MGIGEKIRIRREKLGISQDELARRIGYSSRSSVNKIEKGINDITQSKIIAFAKALDTTPSYLMGWDEEKNDHINKEAKPSKAIQEFCEELQSYSPSSGELEKILEYAKFVFTNRKDEKNG